MGKYNPIGIFDSGVGGLTVVKSLIQELPKENFIYFGDTANVPYGNKKSEQLFNYAYDIINFLIKNKAKAIIVACGTHSSITLPKISKEYNLPIIGVVKPGAVKATSISRNKNIGVLATKATVNSLAYTKEIKAINREFQVFEIACPKFVPLVEAGNLDGIETIEALTEYVEPLKKEGIDTLILGCTHYPFLTKVISDYVGEDIKLVDPSSATVGELKYLLAEKDLLNDKECKPKRDFYVSGNDTSFYNVGKLLLDNIIEKVNKVNLD